MDKHYGSVPAVSCGCIVLERLTTQRAAGFGAYQDACELLAGTAPDHTAYNNALAAFESARRAFRLNQRQWEEHVAEHHLG